MNISLTSTDSKQYWYLTHIQECVLCGKQKKRKERVYIKPIHSILFEQFACSEHFI